MGRPWKRTMWEQGVESRLLRISERSANDDQGDIATRSHRFCRKPEVLVECHAASDVDDLILTLCGSVSVARLIVALVNHLDAFIRRTRDEAEHVALRTLRNADDPFGPQHRIADLGHVNRPVETVRVVRPDKIVNGRNVVAALTPRKPVAARVEERLGCRNRSAHKLGDASRDSVLEDDRRGNVQIAPDLVVQAIGALDHC